MESLHQRQANFPPRHKVWPHSLIPSHRPKKIHSSTYTPLKRSVLSWYRWHFALVWRPGYATPTTFWYNTPPTTACPLCSGMHNQSVHGFIAHCTSHPLHQAWRAAWGIFSPDLCWRTNAQKRDVFLTGKLAIPERFFLCLCSKLGAKRATKAVASIQSKVVNLLVAGLPPLPTDYRPARPSPYNIAEWDLTRAPPPNRRRKVSLDVD